MKNTGMKQHGFFIGLIVLALFITSGAREIRAQDCTGPDGAVGTVLYNTDQDVFQGCTDGGWVAFTYNQYAPPSCQNIGDLCDDGTVFAGWHPITNTALFIPPTDQDISGDFTLRWKTSTGTNDISPESSNDGAANHANRGGAIGNFPAFQACEDLAFGGRSDWYLPSQVEAYYLWSVHETIEAGGNITNFQNDGYWSSTEYGTGSAWYQDVSSGSQYDDIKTSAYRVRCVRR